MSHPPSEPGGRSPTQRAIAEARKVVDFLDGIGEHKRANDVRRLCRSNDSQRVANQQLHRDNMALRGITPLPIPKPVVEPKRIQRKSVWCGFCEMHLTAEQTLACRSRQCAVKAMA